MTESQGYLKSPPAYRLSARYPRYEVWLVCGGRDFADYRLLSATLDSFVRQHGLPRVLVHGNAPGADQMAKKWGRAQPSLIVVDVPAQWERYGRRAAGPIRNKEMLTTFLPDFVIAFPGNTGTRHMVQLAVDESLPVVEILPSARGSAPCLLTTESSALRKASTECEQ